MTILAGLLDHAAFGGQALFWAGCALVLLMPYVAVAIRISNEGVAAR